MVLFCVERRRAWRMLQSRAGLDNPDYRAQRAVIAKLEAGEITRDEAFGLYEQELAEHVIPAGAGGKGRGRPAPGAGPGGPTPRRSGAPTQN